MGELQYQDHNKNARFLATLRPDRSNNPDWPWESVTGMTGRFGPGQIWVIGGMQGNGKTAVLLNLVDHWLDQGVPWVYAGLEMSASMLVSCLGALRCNLPRYRVVDGEMTGPESDAHIGAVTGLEKHTDKYWFIPLGELDPWQFIAAAEDVAEQMGAKVIVLDHLHHLTYPGQNLRVEVSEAFRAMSASAKRMNLTYLVACQLKRTGNRIQRWQVPSTEDLKETGAIEQIADVVLFTHRQIRPHCDKEVKAYLKGEGTPADFEYQGRIALSQEKHRYGRNTGVTSPLAIHHPTDRITEIGETPTLWGDDHDAEREVA